MTGQVCGRLVTGTSSVTLTSNMSGNGIANTDEGSSGPLCSNSIDHCVGHSVDLSFGRV